MEQKENVYPIMKIEEEVEEMINTRINKNFNVERLNHMIKENKSLEELIQRYDRVKNSWGKADSVVKVTGSVRTLLMERKNFGKNKINRRI